VFTQPNFLTPFSKPAVENCGRLFSHPLVSSPEFSGSRTLSFLNKTFEERLDDLSAVVFPPHKCAAVGKCPFKRDLSFFYPAPPPNTPPNQKELEVFAPNKLLSSFSGTRRLRPSPFWFFSTMDVWGVNFDFKSCLGFKFFLFPFALSTKLLYETLEIKPQPKPRFLSSFPPPSQ